MKYINDEKATIQKKNLFSINAQGNPIKGNFLENLGTRADVSSFSMQVKSMKRQT